MAKLFLNATSGGDNTNQYPRVWHIRDHDDNNASTLASLASYSRVTQRILEPNKTISMSLKPSILEATYDGRRAVKLKTGWIDTADNAPPPHYGIKFAGDIGASRWF